MGALPVVLDDLGLDPNEIGKATEPTDNYLSEEEEEELESVITTGPNTPEPHLISSSPIATATTSSWMLDSSSTNNKQHLH
jgi:hypothetical protein